MAVRRQRSVSGPLDVTAWRGADRTKRSGPQAQRRTPLPQITRGEHSPVDAVFASLGPTFEEEMVEHVFGEVNTPDTQPARRALTQERDGTEELDGAQHNVTLLQNKVPPQLPLGYPPVVVGGSVVPPGGGHVTRSS